MIAAEPEPVATISGAGLASVARAFGEFTDLKIDFLRGHSSRVAELAADAAEALGCSRPRPSEVRAAGFFHDLGRVAVPNGIWDKPGPLSAGEWERVRLHPYYTERVLERSPRSRRSRRSPARTTSASTAPATTAGHAPRSSSVGGAAARRRRRL